MAVDRESLPKGLGQQVDAAGQLCRELELTGLEPLLMPDSDGALSGGVTLLMPAGVARLSEAAASQFQQQVFDVLVRGAPLTVQIDDEDDVADGCGILDRAVRAAGARPRDVGLVIRLQRWSPREALFVRQDRLGAGVVHVRTSGVQARQETEVWHQLWQMRNAGLVQGTYDAQLIPACPLLSLEATACVLPLTGIQVPVGTAWLPVRLDVSRFADGEGVLCESAIEHALRRVVEIGDALHGLLHWPTPQLRHDAWLNRRLAVVLDGFGELALRRRLDPASFACLEEFSALLLWMRDILRAQSRLIAQQASSLPLVEQGDPSRDLPGGRMRSDWRKRWLDAIENTAMRHRNLVALSPWSVFPANRPADYRYADLLPLLRFADACTLCGEPDLHSWNVNKFKAFHRRAIAVLQQRTATHQIAERT